MRRSGLRGLDDGVLGAADQDGDRVASVIESHGPNRLDAGLQREGTGVDVLERVGHPTVDTPDTEQIGRTAARPNQSGDGQARTLGTGGRRHDVRPLFRR